MTDNIAKKYVLELATSPVSNQVDEEFDSLSKKQDIYEFNGKCAQCRDIIRNGYAVICAECNAVLHPGCFGTHMVTVHAVGSLSIVVRRNENDGVSRYVIRGEGKKSKKERVGLRREIIHVVGNEIEEVTPSIEVMKEDDNAPVGKKPIPKKRKSQRQERSDTMKRRLADKPVRKDKKNDTESTSEPDDSV